jgi:hypothetical protein
MTDTRLTECRLALSANPSILSFRTHIRCPTNGHHARRSQRRSLNPYNRLSKSQYLVSLSKVSGIRLLMDSTDYQLLWDGPLKAVFRSSGGDLKIERLEIGCDVFADLVPREDKLHTTSNASNRSTSPDAKRSPILSQMGRSTSQMGRSTSDDGKALKSSDINPMGVPDQLMSVLEVPHTLSSSSNPFQVAEVTLYIQPLIDFCTARQLSPLQALKMYPMAQQQVLQPQPQFQPPGQQHWAPPPAHLTSPMNEMSPMAPHTVLPPGTLTGSPTPHHYPSPMSSQTSQTGASVANTTPLLSNRPAPAGSAQKAPAASKRRRTSAVASTIMKEEDEEGMAGNPGAKHPKQSPRIGMGRGGGPGGPGKRMRGDS